MAGAAGEDTGPDDAGSADAKRPRRRIAGTAARIRSMCRRHAAEAPAAGGGGGSVSRKRRYCGAGWSSASAMKAWSPARITAGKTERR